MLTLSAEIFSRKDMTSSSTFAFSMDTVNADSGLLLENERKERLRIVEGVDLQKLNSFGSCLKTSLPFTVYPVVPFLSHTPTTDSSN